MKTFTRLGVLLSVSAIAALGWFASRHWNALPQLSWTPQLALQLIVAVLIFSLAPLAGAAAWYLLLRESREQISPRAAVSIYLVSQFAKYVPGNVGHHIGRLALSREAGVPMATTAATIVAEGAMIVLAACVWATLWLLSAGTGASAVPALADLPSALAVSCLVGLAALAGIWALKRPPAWAVQMLGDRRIALPSLRGLAGCLGLTAAAFLFTGLSTQTLAFALTGTDEVSLLHFGGLFALAWVGGFATPGAPAGAGVRETILLAGLHPDFGAPMALTITLISRAVSLSADVLLFAIGLALRRSRPSGEQGGG